MKEKQLALKILDYLLNYKEFFKKNKIMNNILINKNIIKINRKFKDWFISDKLEIKINLEDWRMLKILAIKQVIW